MSIVHLVPHAVIIVVICSLLLLTIIKPFKPNVGTRHVTTDAQLKYQAMINTRYYKIKRIIGIIIFSIPIALGLFILIVAGISEIFGLNI